MTDKSASYYQDWPDRVNQALRAAGLNDYLVTPDDLVLLESEAVLSEEDEP